MKMSNIIPFNFHEYSFNINIRNEQSATILLIILQILHDCDRHSRNFVTKSNEIAIQIRQEMHKFDKKFQVCYNRGTI